MVGIGRRHNADAWQMRVQRGDIPPVLYLYGEDEGRVHAFAECVRDQCLGQASQAFNFNAFDAAETSIVRAVEAALTLPVLSKRRLVSVSNASAYGKSDWEKALPYLERPSTTTCLLFRGNKTPELKKAVRLIESHGAVLEFRPRTDKQAQDWIQQWVRREGKSISAEAARELIDRVGTKEGDLLGEIRKLTAYTGGRTAIGVDDVEEVAAGARPRKIFDFTDALAERRTSDALQILHQLLEDGTAPLAMLGMMSRQIRLIWLTRDALQKRLGKDQLTQRLAVPSFLHQRLRNQAGKWDELSLWNALEALIRMDRALKSSGLAAELMMDHWVLCHGQASPKRRVRRDPEESSPGGSSKPSTTPSR